MNTQKQSFTAQVIVAVVVGVLSSIGTGLITTYVMTQEFDKKLEGHIIHNQSEAAQIRRDIARIEQENIRRDRESSSREISIHKIETDVAVIRQIIENK